MQFLQCLKKLSIGFKSLEFYQISHTHKQEINQWSVLYNLDRIDRHYTEIYLELELFWRISKKKSLVIVICFTRTKTGCHK